MDLVENAFDLARDPKASKWIAPLQLLGDALLSVLIVWKVPYTKIDWDAYMQQVALYNAGERDYIKIQGETGPLVYPAMHVHIYRLLYYLTDAGRDIKLAQYIFIGVYLATLMMVMQCYRMAKVPPYIFPLLSLSKRVHSIYMLRLFNDGIAVLFLFMAIYLYQKRAYTLGSIMYSLGLGVKMSLLLALPAVGVVLWQGAGRDRALLQAQFIAQVQFITALPFISTNWRSYVGRAFEFTRQFLFKWTVNWRFVGEDWFLSKPFSIALLGLHVFFLYIFGVSRWLKPSGSGLFDAIAQLVQPPAPEVQHAIAGRVTSQFTLATILSAMMIGCLCARSLHYQFFVYIAWSTPFLLWRSKMNPIFIYVVCFAQECAWNVYPSTSASSGVVVGCLALTVVGVWIGTSRYMPATRNPTAKVAPQNRVD